VSCVGVAVTWFGDLWQQSGSSCMQLTASTSKQGRFIRKPNQHHECQLLNGCLCFHDRVPSLVQLCSRHLMSLLQLFGDAALTVRASASATARNLVDGMLDLCGGVFDCYLYSCW